MSVTLYGFPFSTYTWAARLGLAAKGVDYTLAPARLGDAAYRELHPFGKMPVLDHDGFRVFETFAVLRYVDEAFEGPALQPATAAGRARMTQWASAYNDFVAPKAVRGVLIPRLVLPSRGIAPDDAKIAAAATAAQSALQVFDKAVASSPFLAGEAPSLADFLLAPTYSAGARLSGADRYTDGLPNLNAWFARIAAMPAWAATAG